VSRPNPSQGEVPEGVIDCAMSGHPESWRETIVPAVERAWGYFQSEHAERLKEVERQREEQRDFADRYQLAYGRARDALEAIAAGKYEDIIGEAGDLTVADQMQADARAVLTQQPSSTSPQQEVEEAENEWQRLTEIGVGIQLSVERKKPFAGTIEDARFLHMLRGRLNRGPALTQPPADPDPRLGYELASEALKDGRRVQARLSGGDEIEGTVVSVEDEYCIIDTSPEGLGNPTYFYRALWLGLDRFEILPADRVPRCGSPNINRLRRIAAAVAANAPDWLLSSTPLFLQRLADELDCQSTSELSPRFTADEKSLLIARLARGKSCLKWRAEEEEAVIDKLRALLDQTASTPELLGEEVAKAFKLLALHWYDGFEDGLTEEDFGAEQFLGEGLVVSDRHDEISLSANGEKFIREVLVRLVSSSTQPVSESPGGFCDQCEKPKAEVANLLEGESLCASCLLVRATALLTEAEGHDYKLTDADHCPFCGQDIAPSESPGDSGEPEFKELGTEGHRVVLTFDGGGPSLKLLHPETGCETATQCGLCGRRVDDPESKPCYDCKDGFDPDCWLTDWFANLGADELLHGSVTVAVTAEWDQDHPKIVINGPDLSDLTQPAPGNSGDLFDKLVNAAKRVRHQFTLVLDSKPAREVDEALGELDSVLREVGEGRGNSGGVEEVLRKLEGAGERLAVEARHRLAEIAGDDVDHPAWQGPQAQALKVWNEARNSLRPDAPPADNSATTSTPPPSPQAEDPYPDIDKAAVYKRAAELRACKTDSEAVSLLVGHPVQVIHQDEPSSPQAEVQGDER
jgi:hypothetical protein